MAKQTQNIRTLGNYSLSAAVVTVAALVLTGCGQPSLVGSSSLAAAESEASAGQSPSAAVSTKAAPAKPAALDPEAVEAAPAVDATVPAVEESEPALAVAPQSSIDPAAATQPAAADRSGLVTGSYQPSTATTGVPAGTVLTPHNTSGADLVITQAGTVLDGLDIYGDIKVRAANVTIKNSRLHGGTHIPGSNTGIIDANSSAVSNLVVQDNTIIPDQPSYYRDGIVGHDYTALRNHIQGTNDGLGIFNRPGGPAAANVSAEGNYIHSLTFWSNDPAHSDGTHNDGIQVQGGENIRLAGTNVVANAVLGEGSGPNPRGDHAGIGIMLQQNVAKLANVVVENNWVDDGQTSINIANGVYANITVTVRNNYLGRNQYDFGSGSTYPIRIISRSASTVYGLDSNRWADTLGLLVEGRDGGIRYNS